MSRMLYTYYRKRQTTEWQCYQRSFVFVRPTMEGLVMRIATPTKLMIFGSRFPLQAGVLYLNGRLFKIEDILIAKATFLSRKSYDMSQLRAVFLCMCRMSKRGRSVEGQNLAQELHHLAKRRKLEIEERKRAEKERECMRIFESEIEPTLREAANEGKFSVCIPNNVVCGMTFSEVLGLIRRKGFSVSAHVSRFTVFWEKC